MLDFEANQGARSCDGLSRRDFLRAGTLSAGAVGLTLADLTAAEAAAGGEVNCILLLLVGGPSQLDTWDPKPKAPTAVRGPFRPIPTRVPGVQISEHFPRMAAAADRFSIVRSVHHTEAPIHETGHQLLQTGRLARGDPEHPHYGAVLSALRGRRPGGPPPFVVLPGPVGNTGVSVGHGQTAGYLGAGHEPVFLAGDPNSGGLRLHDPDSPGGLDPAHNPDPDALRDAVDQAHRAHDAARKHRPDGAADRALDRLFGKRAKQAFALAREKDDVRARYGRNTFGQSCLLARRLVEHGVRLVTVNMFHTVFNTITWDCHADGSALPATLDDYRDVLCPMFDRAYTALLDDLHQRGLLDTTLVVAMGEFGRTPRLNSRGGRDHWPGVWSILLAGGGVRGGRVVGSSDRLGAEPRDRPVSPAEVAATVYHALGLDPAARLPGPDQRSWPLADAAPVRELF